MSDYDRITKIMKDTCNFKQLVRIGEDSSDSVVYSFECNKEVLVAKVRKSGPSLSSEWNLLRKLSKWKIVPHAILFSDQIIIMKYIPMTMARWLNTMPTPADMRYICANLVSKLKSFHSLGYVHGDMHTNNVLVDPVAIECYIIDFSRNRDDLSPKDNLMSLRDGLYGFPMDMAKELYGYETPKYKNVVKGINEFESIFNSYVSDMYGITLQEQQEQEQ